LYAEKPQARPSRSALGVELVAGVLPAGRHAISTYMRNGKQCLVIALPCPADDF